MTPETIEKLKAFFPPEDHKERDLPGGGRWFYVPWQLIRDRLDQCCPDWEVSYSSPIYIGEYCAVSCKLTIEGISREAIGNAPLVLVSKQGKDMSRGSPIERAIADAFKNAAEQFGVGAYLDKQEDLVRYLHSKQDYRGKKFYDENDWKKHGAMGKPKNSPSAKNQIKPKNQLALNVDECIKYAQSQGIPFERAEDIIIECKRDRIAIFERIKQESSAIATK